MTSPFNFEEAINSAPDIRHTFLKEFFLVHNEEEFTIEMVDFLIEVAILGRMPVSIIRSMVDITSLLKKMHNIILEGEIDYV